MSEPAVPPPQADPPAPQADPPAPQAGTLTSDAYDADDILAGAEPWDPAETWI